MVNNWLRKSKYYQETEDLQDQFVEIAALYQAILDEEDEAEDDSLDGDRGDVLNPDIDGDYLPEDISLFDEMSSCPEEAETQEEDESMPTQIDDFTNYQFSNDFDDDIMDFEMDDAGPEIDTRQSYANVDLDDLDEAYSD